MSLKSIASSWSRWLPLAAALLLAAPAHAQSNPDWTTPVTPFRIAGNLYYVGSRDLASYLLVTPAGAILINSNLESSVAQIHHSVEQLGYRFSDIHVLLISHSHFDHDAGSAEVKRQTGAQYMVMDDDVPVVESGGAKDFQYGQRAATRPRRSIASCMTATKCVSAAACWSLTKRPDTLAAAPPGRYRCPITAGC